MDSQRRILLLDDDYESLLPLKNFLETVNDHSVELTANEAILDRLSTEIFDLICVDNMIYPTSLDKDNAEVRNIHFDNVNWKATGIEFIRRLRRGEFQSTDRQGTSSQVPVIILSAVPGTLISDLDLLANENLDYVEKPFDLASLVDRIDQLLEQ